MIRSMTGYSSGRSQESDFSLSVSLKGTNHRFFDLQVRLPQALEQFEPLVRGLVKDQVSRGHLEVTVNFERAGVQTLQLNRPLLEGYVAACDGLRERFGALASPDPVALLRIPGIIVASDNEFTPELRDRIRSALERALGQALAGLQSMRGTEGQALERDLRQRLGRMRTLAKGVEHLATSVPELYRQRLEHRLRELGGDTPGAPLAEPGRLAQEVLYLASRSDIAEELTRLKSHLDQAERLLEEGAEVGKKLDFLLQEMNREANTILSKTTDVPGVGPEISRQSIEMKTEIEKLREQAQNIE
jgi:uncharacterized protein (TIGR00255 family)